jgi:dipeptidyl aminopeptidase/acylaminoacyl peptidase
MVVFLRVSVVFTCSLLLISSASAQVTRLDYERATGLSDKYEYLTVNVPDPATWIPNTGRFYYRKSVKGGHEFVVMDAETRQRRPAFDQQRLAEALGKETAATYTPVRLPFSEFTFADGERKIEFSAERVRWQCDLSNYSCKQVGPPAGFAGRHGLGGPVRDSEAPVDDRPRRSPDGKWEALVRNFNLAVRSVGAKQITLLSTDGSEGSFYDLTSVVWSPDSSRIAAYRVKPGYRRLIHYVESSPEDQLQPKHATFLYTKPGDVLDLERPTLFHVSSKTQMVVSDELFPNPYDLSSLVWRKDSRGVTFEYNQRGHAVYRVIEVDASTGKARAVISEEPKTFFYYNQANHTRSAGKRFRDDIDDGKEVIWMSERDGWNHLYLLDGASGAVRNQITKGEWAVRGVARVDHERRQIYFSAGGMYPGRDPYLLHYYRINFDGTGLTPLTQVDADHQVQISPDLKYYVDTYSRVDLAPVSELRRLEDASLVAEIERGDITELVKSGWKAPEVFVAKGRDGKTDIWGMIVRPASFDPAKKYAVIENIYAGPHGSHVPKSFSPFIGHQSQAELGFIVVQIDAMGTSNRSKAFHDVAWQNLGDAGFPDRILWHKAVAAKYPSYDVSRVGIYGGSAGGQNSLGALLFHPEFYKVAVSYEGCHDNRMDKLWWNEQWMGWPIGPQYSASSNVDNAWRLQGRVLLVAAELDTNVDPSSTYQVANALIKGNKTFDMLMIPGGSHGAGRSAEASEYGERKRFDFFVQHLLGQQPPDWNQSVPSKTSTADGLLGRGRK